MTASPAPLSNVPHMLIFVCVYFFSVDGSGVDVTKAQDTPVAIKREDPYIVFDVDVEIQKPLERMPKG